MSLPDLGVDPSKSTWVDLNIQRLEWNRFCFMPPVELKSTSDFIPTLLQVDLNRLEIVTKMAKI